MKRLVWGLLFCFFAAHSEAWVFLDSVNPNASGWILPKIISGRSVHVCIDVVDRQTNPVSHRRQTVPYAGEHLPEYYQQAAKVTQAAYQSWFDNLRIQIRQTKRKKEFKDLLALMPERVAFSFINGPQGEYPYISCEQLPAQEIDLRIRATLFKQSSGGYAVQQGRASFTFWLQPQNMGLAEDNDPQFVIKDRSSLQIARHEAGHTLGLGDLYIANASPENSSIYTLEAFYPAKSIASVMNKEADLTCDDADGLANLLDFFAGHTSSSRREKGWISFCPGRHIAYAHALPVEITSAQMEELRSFAQNGWEGKNPIAAPLSAARHKADSLRAEAQSLAAQRHTSQTREALKQGLSLKSNKPTLSVHAPHRCAVCGQEITEADFVRLSYPKKEVWAFVHRACNQKRKQQGGKIPPADLLKYGEPIR